MMLKFLVKIKQIILRQKNQNIIKVTVQIGHPSSKSVSVKLNRKYKLSEIRKILAKNSEIKMNDTFSFAKINNTSSSTGESSLAVIAREDEDDEILKKIIDKKSKKKMFLYLLIKSVPDKPNWRDFKDKLKLEYGCSVTLERANKKAFKIVNCEMNEIVDRYENSKIQIDSEEAKIITKNFFLIADIDIPNFVKLGVSVGNSNIKNSKTKTNSAYSVIEYNKMSLKFQLEPTTEFIDAVKDVINSKDSRKVKDIINEFGKFIPKEVILGGGAYLIAREYSEENTGEHSTNIGGQIQSVKIKRQASKSLTRNKSIKYQAFKLIGGNQFSPSNFNEEDWADSLKEFKTWDCIKFKDPINIFQLLPRDLYKQILMLVGKKILYTNTEDYTCHLSEPGIYHTFKFNIPEYILEIFQNKDADCNIFATVIDKGEKEKDVFNCQVVWPPNDDPRLIIYCIQKKFKKRECKLKIGWMIIGYDINFNRSNYNYNVKLKILKNDFNSSNRQEIIKSLEEYNESTFYFGIPVLNYLNNSNNSPIIGHHFINDKGNNRIGAYIFSYCLKKKHYVNLPKFTFHTLIISNYSNSGNYGISHFQHISSIKKMFKHDSLKSKPKFISMYSTRENEYGPIFLKQKSSEIKIRYTGVNCKNNDCICKRKKFKKPENNLRYAFFAFLDP